MTNTTKVTADAARTMDRFSFIALFLVATTRRAVNRGGCEYRVQHSRGEYRVVSPIAGGTVVYCTTNAAALFDFARRTELGVLTREAEEFRILASQVAA